jgi:hypothetical protein
MSVPIEIQPQPTPVQVITTVVDTPGGRLVVANILMVTGQAVLFLDGESAIKVGRQLVKDGQQAKTGLTIAGPGMLPPFQPPPNGSAS